MSYARGYRIWRLSWARIGHRARVWEYRGGRYLKSRRNRKQRAVLRWGAVIEFI